MSGSQGSRYSQVFDIQRGNRVLISCISACGKCDACRKAMYSHCQTGGWILGNTIDGTQAEYVRTPHAETSLYHAARRTPTKTRS